MISITLLNHYLMICFYCIAEAPRITTHPQELKDAVPGQTITFTVHATGAEPISYQWLWKPAGDEQEGSEEWQPCNMEWCDGTTLKIPSVLKLNEGSYQCVISNCAGSQISTAAKLSIGKYLDINRMKHLSSILLSISCTADPPQVTIHPKALKDAVPGQPVTFTVHATGTKPIKYQWQWKPAGEEGGSEEWQLCDTELCSGNALYVPNVKKLKLQDKAYVVMHMQPV